MKNYDLLFSSRANAEVKQAAASSLHRHYGWIDNLLAQHDFFYGDSFTIADAYLFTVTGWAGLVKLDLSAFTHVQQWLRRVAAAVAGGLAESGADHRSEIADLYAEGFDPRFTPQDLAHFRNQGAVPDDVRAEQQRLERADALVLVYPVYWWSFPGQLKGWVDRVFTNGWAYDERPDGGLNKRLGRLQVHQLAIGASNQGTWDRRGYSSAHTAQIEQGIFGYVGAPVISSQLLLLPEEGGPQTMLEKARVTGNRLFS